jgi:DNA replication and repair protein RecF
MRITEIRLNNFRNYGSLKMRFDKRINVLIGDNAQGKTNLLEAISFLSTVRSFRIKDETDLIKKDCEIARIEGVIASVSGEKRLTVMIGQTGKSLLIHKNPVKRTSEFIGQCNAVLFTPADMDFFEAPPKVRRRMMDVELSKLSPVYMENLNQYAKVLKERNLYLKQDRPDVEYLEVLSDRLVALQIPIIESRREFLDFISKRISALFCKFMDENFEVDIKYESESDSQTDLAQQIGLKMSASLKRDLAFKITHVGIHRDDAKFTLNGFDVSSFASQGQKRMLILALKMAILEFIVSKINTYPILLLDDVFSELDTKKKDKFTQLLPKDVQILITTTDISDINGWPASETDVFVVRNGAVAPFKEDYR